MKRQTRTFFAHAWPKAAVLHLISLLLVATLLSGCGAIWDDMYPPTEVRDQMTFHLAREQPYSTWPLRMGAQGKPRAYVQPQALFQGSAIDMAAPMVDAQGRYFVGVKLGPDAARRLAQATQTDVQAMALVWQGRLFQVLKVQEPIALGTFAIPVSNAASAQELSRILNDRSSI